MEPERLKDEKSVPVRGLEQWRLFFSEVRNELERVTWPSRREVYATTVVVIAITVTLGLLLFGFDVLLDRLEFWLLGRFGNP